MGSEVLVTSLVAISEASHQDFGFGVWGQEVWGGVPYGLQRQDFSQLA